MQKQEIIFVGMNDAVDGQQTPLGSLCQKADRVFILTDENTRRLCLPILYRNYARELQQAEVITIAAGDSHKTLESVSHVWSELQRLGATRHSLLINLGGGMITDLGGFAASTFKRGMPFVNIPTTLLAMVDASVGGKTGINFGGLKNEVGVFRNADTVIIDTRFLQTLDRENLLSGYAEMLKHALLDGSDMLARHLRFDVEDPDLAQLQQMVADSLQVKQRIVLDDPTEQGIRKALNLGHTVGHAFEALTLLPSPFALHPSPESPSPFTPHPSPESPLLHGYAVAWGLVSELYLSVVKTGFPIERMRQVVTFILEHYGRMPITCDDYPTLLELMRHDKKNVSGRINFTLLADVGDIRINQHCTQHEIEEALDFYREGY